MWRLLATICLVAPLMAQADEPEYKWIGYRCDVAAGRLSIAFLPPAGNDVDRRAAEGWKTWDVGTLISMKDDDHIGKLRTIKAECRLGSTAYAIALGPEPQNMNIQGRCGAADLAAWTAVRRNGKTFLPRTELGPICFGKARYITEVDIDVRSAEPTFTFASDEQ
jgi:hypothetical protein